MTDDRIPPPLTPAVFHVLLSLADGPLHGYAIMKRVEEESGLAMGPGTIYGSLRRLADAGWVEERQDPDGDRRRSTSFQLTPEGTKALKAEAGRITRLASLDPVRRLAPDGRGS